MTTVRGLSNCSHWKKLIKYFTLLILNASLFITLDVHVKGVAALNTFLMGSFHIDSFNVFNINNNGT